MAYETKRIYQLSPGAGFPLTPDNLTSLRGGRFHHSLLVPQSQALLRTTAQLPLSHPGSGGGSTWGRKAKRFCRVSELS